MPRIAHIGDCHFKSDRIEESLKCFYFAVDAARERGCQAIVIPGDIWDKSVLADEESGFNDVLDAMKYAVASCRDVILCYGNHDKAGSLHAFSEVGVRVVSQPVGEAIGGVWYSVLPYPTKQFLVSQTTGTQDETDAAVVQALRTILVGFGARRAEMAPELPHVLLFHGNVLGSVTESGQVMYGGDVMVSIADLDLANCDYGAFNHIHKAQNFGKYYYAGSLYHKAQNFGKYYYAGSLYHKDFGELDAKSINIVDVEVGRNSVEKVILPTTPMAVVRMTFNDEGGWTLNEADYEAHCRLVNMVADVKVKYKVRPEQVKLVDESQIVAMYPKAKVKCEREIIQQERIRCVGIAEKARLRDKVRAWGETVNEMIGEGVLLKADEIERECR